MLPKSVKNVIDVGVRISRLSSARIICRLFGRFENKPRNRWKKVKYVFSIFDVWGNFELSSRREHDFQGPLRENSVPNPGLDDMSSRLFGSILDHFFASKMCWFLCCFLYAFFWVLFWRFLMIFEAFLRAFLEYFCYLFENSNFVKIAPRRGESTIFKVSKGLKTLLFVIFPGIVSS